MRLMCFHLQFAVYSSCPELIMIYTPAYELNNQNVEYVRCGPTKAYHCTDKMYL